jgi:hypothetical protein
MFYGCLRTISLSAIIDSSASSLFINKKFIYKNNIKTHKLPKNIPLYNIDNSPNSISLISKYTILRTQIGKEKKNLIFLVVDIGQENVILGIDWLRLENPIINWKEGRVEIGDLEEEDEEERLRCFLKEEKAPWLSATIELPLEYHQYSKVFSEKESQCFPLSKLYNHKIDLMENAKMKRSKVYPLSIPELKELDNYLEENLKKGYIRKSQSPFASPFFFIPKKNGKLRPIVDYRKLNSITVKNSYPLPLISSIVDGLLCARIFTKLDLRWGYNNVLIKNGHQERAAFITPRGLFEPLVMTFGLCNAPATFQAMMDNIFGDLIAQGLVFVYIDDIIIATETLDQHQQLVHKVLTRLAKNDLFASLEKCLFEVRQVEFLGMIIVKSTQSLAH